MTSAAEFAWREQGYRLSGKEGTGLAASGASTEFDLEAHFFAASDPGMPAPDLPPLMSHFPVPVEGYPQPA